MIKEIIASIKKDIDSKTAWFTSGTLLITVIFAIYNGFLGIHHSSIWHGSICVYYILLALILEIILVSERYIYKHDVDKERTRKKVFLITSVVLLLINTAMIYPTAMMVQFKKPVGMTLIPALAAAVYTTFKVFTALHKLKRRLTSGNLLIREIWTINVVDAAFSVITLQNTLIMVAGDPNDRNMFILSAITSGIIIAGMLIMEIILFVWEVRKFKWN